MVLALIAQAAGTVEDLAKNLTNQVVETDLVSTTATTAARSVETSTLWNHILTADPIVQLTLAILVVFSVMCWAIIFYKFFQLKSAQRRAQRFWQKFSGTIDMVEIANTKAITKGPVYQIFNTGHITLGKIKKTTNKMSDFHRDILAQRMNQSREEELYKMEQYVNFLATTAAAAPFIGLFGTVWGILTAFMAIGQANSSSLATVGPYISEALIATAVGLFAAIPAVIFYNYFVSKIRLISKVIDLFMSDFMIKSEREIST
ncbi:MotA/TolQ/ExbB proton channel family protein [bacterium]|nr:MotA/TolQ/ExbB proton channel family protein [bacterium]